MKINTTTHPKFLRLKRRLKLPIWGVVGVLEALWHFTAQNAKNGAIGKYPDEDIAAGIDWADDPTELVENLIACGWLDVCPVYRLLVHDWADHAPNFVKGVVARTENGWAITKIDNSNPRSATQGQQPKVGNPGSATQGRQPPKPIPKPIPIPEPNPPTPQGGPVDFFDGIDLTESPPPKPPKPKKPPKPPRPKPPDYEPATATLPAQLDGPGFRAAWVDWFEYRTASRFPKWVEKTIEAQLKQFTEWGPEAAISAIAKSIANGWKGIFEPEQRQAPRQQQKAPPTSDERMRVIDAQTRAAMGLPPREGNPVLLAVRPPEKISIAFAPAVNTIPESTLRLLRREPLTRGG